MKDENTLIPIEKTNITNMIYIIRVKQVMIDRDLADLYQVQTKRLNEQVKRNLARFPKEFCFRLSAEEKNELVANCDQFTSKTHQRILDDKNVAVVDIPEYYYRNELKKIGEL